MERVHRAIREDGCPLYLREDGCPLYPFIYSLIFISLSLYLSHFCIVAFRPAGATTSIHP